MSDNKDQQGNIPYVMLNFVCTNFVRHSLNIKKRRHAKYMKALVFWFPKVCETFTKHYTTLDSNVFYCQIISTYFRINIDSENWSKKRMQGQISTISAKAFSFSYRVVTSNGDFILFRFLCRINILYDKLYTFLFKRIITETSRLTHCLVYCCLR